MVNLRIQPHLTGAREFIPHFPVKGCKKIYVIKLHNIVWPKYVDKGGRLAGRVESQNYIQRNVNVAQTSAPYVHTCSGRNATPIDLMSQNQIYVLLCYPVCDAALYWTMLYKNSAKTRHDQAWSGLIPGLRPANLRGQTLWRKYKYYDTDILRSPDATFNVVGL